MKIQPLDPPNGGGRRREQEETLAEKEAKDKKAAREAAIVAAAALEKKRETYRKKYESQKNKYRHRKTAVKSRQVKAGHCAWCGKDFGEALKIHQAYCGSRPTGTDDADLSIRTEPSEPRLPEPDGSGTGD